MKPLSTHIPTRVSTLAKSITFVALGLAACERGEMPEERAAAEGGAPLILLSTVGVGQEASKPPAGGSMAYAIGHEPTIREEAGRWKLDPVAPTPRAPGG